MNSSWKEPDFEIEIKRQSYPDYIKSSTVREIGKLKKYAIAYASWQTAYHNKKKKEKCWKVHSFSLAIISSISVSQTLSKPTRQSLANCICDYWLDK